MKSLYCCIAVWFFSANVSYAQENSADFSLNTPPKQFSLVIGLKEISGLALASENSVYAHNDEYGIVYEISLKDGAMVSAFALGDPTVAADFEGIAVENGRIYLITSAGLLYEALIGVHRSRVLFNILDTGVGRFCEVEGLANGAAEGEFLILCKTPLVKELNGKLAIYRWSAKDRLPASSPWLSISIESFLDKASAAQFRPSAIEWDHAHKVLAVLSARSHQMAVVSEDGMRVNVQTLPQTLHAQAEGIALTPSGDLVIADEAPLGRGAGKLSIYKLER